MKALMGFFKNFPSIFLFVKIDLFRLLGQCNKILPPSVQMTTRLCQWNDGLSQAAMFFAFVLMFLSQSQE